MLKQEIHDLIVELEESFDNISIERKSLLSKLSNEIGKHLKEKDEAKICIICTHNSRRSQLGQLWLSVAARYYGLNSIKSFSGGTEGTAFNFRMVNALISFGFDFRLVSAGENPSYHVSYSDLPDIDSVYFSKVYSHPTNPSKNFIAVLVCDSADEACPIVAGASHRIYHPYEDPKSSDGTEFESSAYRDKVMEIGREFLFCMSLLK